METGMNLEEIRQEIDSLDKQIAQLLCRRMEITKKVAAYKKENNLPVYHPQREQAVIEKVSALGGREYSDALAAVYQCIMGQSKALQRQWLEQE